MTTDTTALVPTRRCAGCATEMPLSLLACPGCGNLVHAETMKALAVEADGAEVRGDATGALAAWRKVLALLPAESKQHASVLDIPKAQPTVAAAGQGRLVTTGDQSRSQAGAGARD